jgi:hypothetical protein
MNEAINKKTGSCLCGEVKYEVIGEFESFYLCHCNRCRKDTGSAHAANLFSLSAQLKWLSGQESVKTYNLPSTRHSKSFCTNCGSALPVVQDNGKLLVVPAGSLDTVVLKKPNAHLFLASKAEWDKNLEQVEGFDGLPC